MPNRVGKFFIVSHDEFVKDYKKCGIRKYNDVEEAYSKVSLPVRATWGSAGYDFVSPITFVLKPGETITIPTGIRCYIDDGWFLSCFPRSGHGFKYKIRLANTIGIIDSDYYGSDNEGHIMLKISNEGDKTFAIDAGMRIMQGIFVPFGITLDDDVKISRNGGFGSTGA